MGCAEVCSEERGNLLNFALSVDYAFQPIISTTSRKTHGFEALARMPDARFANVGDLLDQAFACGVLRRVEGILLRRATSKFAAYPENAAFRLFCNLDNRVFDGRDSDDLLALDLFEQINLPFDRLCLELSERDTIIAPDHMVKLAQFLGRNGARVALDDFGVGVSSLQLLLTVEPHYVKIDRCFIHQVSSSTRKQAIVAKLCELAHSLGFFTVAEGVESETDFRMARDLGCDFAQGYHIAFPSQSMAELSGAYCPQRTEPRAPQMDPRVVEMMTDIPPLLHDAPLSRAVDAFRADPKLALVPVVDRQGVLQGVILEEEVRNYLLSDFGPSLLANKSVAPRASDLTKRCAVADANGSVETIVNSYVAAEIAHGMILTSDGLYTGYLTNHALLRLASEREVVVAREQSPLTKLPGNSLIKREIVQALGHNIPTTLCLLDFDHFKAFNDVYGFAAGDTVLTLFARLLKELEQRVSCFAGHIGGDDFFLALTGEDAANTLVIRDLCRRFSLEAANLYSRSDRERRGILALDRYGQERFFPLLRASGGVLHLPASRAHLTQAMVEMQLAAAKDQAKKSTAGISVTRLPEHGVELLTDQISQALLANAPASLAG